ncbi:MAG: GlsB/YeaQ/YmgE family stress response membrane protein, partial [Cytophagaceae bacterium]|nr:GlsB/YeaQ/YmgE family stress response membrane protein [Cytophagaceae bacterium]
MSILAWIILGGFAGWIGSMVMHTDASQGILLNIVVGIVGALVGGAMFNFFGTPGVTGFNLYSLLVAIVGS